ncbi:Restriction endonuclease [Aromatoleum tolulyticum]|uniref:Restriction endonuclease n=1 Tax=Aromatoleum tolulyticum TaxID=34027 RepID=A0A1N6T6B2_9RHOO|nr:restriction endonuclease [Aromatoleum tolulyticum]SIQ48853.1 Restriction endonuclease [Aromatoleum tolulyticum]
MPRYNFDALSPQDFEELARDLLQAEWGVRLEAFRAGRDRGIDLRYSPGPGRGTIVQCKHYAQSGFSKLLAHLRDNELPKIRLLRPCRYVVVTTVRLTPDNKGAIAAAMAPYVQNPSVDIFGGDDIESLLSRHPRVEQANFKLWLTSTAVLENVLHNAERCRTDFEVERIRRKLPLFVQSESFNLARQMLDDNRVLIISGPPGIGKTTLAEMLLYAYLDMGYEPVVIESKVKEGRNLFKSSEKQLFYFDDFLGQTFLGDSRDYLGGNQDRAIVDFMEMVRSSNESRFILTTREHILQNAVILSERLSHSHVLRDRIVLTMSEYAFGHRARMLYNHVFFSDLPLAHKVQITANDFFLTIIKHQHFSPRLVEWLTDFTRVRAIGAEGYQGFISALLDNPELLWEHAFRNQISEAARSALLCLYTVGDWRERVDFELDFQALHTARAQKYNFRTSASDCQDALRELDGAFLSFSRGHISFLNPSVKEFVAGVIASQQQVAGDVLASATRMKQLGELWKLAKAKPRTSVSKLFQGTQPLLITRIRELLDTPTHRWYKGAAGKTFGATVDLSKSDRLIFLAEMCDQQESAEVARVLQPIVRSLLDDMGRSFNGVWSTMRLLTELGELPWYLLNGGDEVRREVTNQLIAAAEWADAEQWVELLDAPKVLEYLTEEDRAALDAAFEKYKVQGIREELRNVDDLDAKKSLVSSLEDLGKKCGYQFGTAIAQLAG